jgi:hypothetical protein
MNPDAPFESFIRHGRDGSVLYHGELAIQLHRGMTLRSHIASFRGPASDRRLLVLVQAFTGRRYKPDSAAERWRAINDLDDWIAGMELVVPVIEEH